MTESEWLEIAKKVRGNWSGFCLEKQQFDTFYEALKEFDIKDVREAADRIVRGYAYPPIVATFTVYIEEVQKDERYEVESAEKRRVETVKVNPKGDGGWVRFTQWMMEMKKKWPPTLAGGRVLKAKFEKEHPNWQPKKRRTI